MISADTKARIAKEIEADPDSAYFHDDKVKRFGWNEGYIVELDEQWFYCDNEGDLQRQLPSFIKSKADARDFILEANSWYVAGHTNGKNAAKRELRDWLNAGIEA